MTYFFRDFICTSNIKTSNLIMRYIASLVYVLIVFIFSCKKNSEQPNDNHVKVADADGNVYPTIRVGNQIWMKENLKTTKFNDGTPITEYSFAIHGSNWLNSNSPKALYRWADTKDLNNIHAAPLPFDYYGAMYNHLAIESGKLAPAGWRIPTQQDFIILKNYLANNGQAGKEARALKSSSGWLTLSGNGIDAIGFRGLPNGYVNAVGGATLAEGICSWATTDFNPTNQTRKLVQLFDKDTILILDNPIQIGAGIRCVKE